MCILQSRCEGAGDLPNPCTCEQRDFMAPELRANTGRSEAPPGWRRLTTRFICKLLPAATSKTSPHPATHLADPLLGQGAGRSTPLHSKPPISHTPALATDIFVPTPRAALNYFAESHFHIPPSNSPPRSHQSLSAFTLQ